MSGVASRLVARATRPAVRPRFAAEGTAFQPARVEPAPVAVGRREDAVGAPQQPVLAFEALDEPPAIAIRAVGSPWLEAVRTARENPPAADAPPPKPTARGEDHGFSSKPPGLPRVDHPPPTPQFSESPEEAVPLPLRERRVGALGAPSHEALAATRPPAIGATPVRALAGASGTHTARPPEAIARGAHAAPPQVFIDRIEVITPTAPTAPVDPLASLEPRRRGASRHGGAFR